MHTVILFVWQYFVDNANHEIIVTTNILVHRYTMHGNILLFFNFGFKSVMDVKHFTPPATGNLVTVLPAVLVPAFAVLIVGAVVVVAFVMRRKNVAVKSRDKADMISANREETKTGLVDTYIIKLRSYAKCHHPVAVLTNRCEVVCGLDGLICSL